VNQQAMLTDLDGLRQALDQRLVDLNTKIGASNTDLRASQGVTSTLTSTLESLRTSKAELEAETAKQLQLTQQRDLAWETYKTVSSKVAELNLTRAAASSEVRFGAPAVAPEDAVQDISLVLVIVVGGVLGLVAAIFYTFIANYLGKVPLTGKP
jgi:uncharacterized protein involved in exopolysaccharide biosynthesis